MSPAMQKGGIMYCSKCGKEIDDNADVCLGCGTLIHHTKGKFFSSKIANCLSIGTLVFCCLFTILGLLSFFFFSTESFALRIEDQLSGSSILRTIWLMPSLISLFAISLSSVSSLVLLFNNGNKRINISTICISVVFFIIAALIVLFTF